MKRRYNPHLFCLSQSKESGQKRNRPCIYMLSRYCPNHLKAWPSKPYYMDHTIHRSKGKTQMRKLVDLRESERERDSKSLIW